MYLIFPIFSKCYLGRYLPFIVIPVLVEMAYTHGDGRDKRRLEPDESADHPAVRRCAVRHLEGVTICLVVKPTYRTLTTWTSLEQSC